MAVADYVIPIHSERTVKPSFPRRRESIPGPAVNSGDDGKAISSNTPLPVSLPAMPTRLHDGRRPK